MARPRARSLGCPSCASPIDVKNALKARTVVCPSCGSQLDLSRQPFEVIGAFAVGANAPEEPLAIGMRGTLPGQVPESFEIIGRIRLQGQEADDYGAIDVYQWDEWLLLTERGQSVWLEVDEGEYELQHALDEPPVSTEALLAAPVGGRSADHTFHLIERGQAHIIHVEGELTWRAKVGDPITYADFLTSAGPMGAEWTDEEVEFFTRAKVTERQVFEMLGHKDLLEAQATHARELSRTMGLAWAGPAGVYIVAAALAFVGMIVASGVQDVMYPYTNGSGTVSPYSLAEQQHVGSLELEAGVPYELTVDAEYSGDVSTLVVDLQDPAGVAHPLVAVERKVRYASTASHTTSFTPESAGTYELRAHGTLDPTIGGDYRPLGVRWKLRERAPIQSWPFTWSIAVLLGLGALTGAVSRGRHQTARRTETQRWREERSRLAEELRTHARVHLGS